MSNMESTISGVTRPTSIVKIPNEVLVKIFSYNATQSPRDLLQYRLVCQHWKSLVEEHFDFNVTLDDVKMDLTLLSKFRAKCCIIKSFRKTIPESHQLFQNMSFLKKMFVWGSISKENFQRTISSATQVQDLSLTAKVFFINGFMSSCIVDKFSEFWGQLRTLKIEFEDCESYKHQTKILHNLSQLLHCRMASLKTLSLRVNASYFDPERRHGSVYVLDSATRSVMEFLGSHPQLSLIQVFMFNSFDFGSSRHPEICEALAQKLAAVQLESLAISTCHSQMGAWTALISRLRSLKNLRISLTDRDGFASEMCLFNYLENALIQNQSKLRSIAFNQFFLTAPLNARIFRDMGNLKRLVLHLNDKSEDVENAFISNLKMLPISLEILDIHNITCESADLLLMADRLDNIKTVELLGTGNGNGMGINRAVFQSLAEKRNVQKVIIRPINIDRRDCIQVSVRINEKSSRIANVRCERSHWINFDFDDFRKECLKEMLDPKYD